MNLNPIFNLYCAGTVHACLRPGALLPGSTHQHRHNPNPAHAESDPLQSGVADLSLQSRRSAVQQQSYGTSQMARAVLPWPTLARLARVFLIELLAARG